MCDGFYYLKVDPITISINIFIIFFKSLLPQGNIVPQWTNLNISHFHAEKNTIFIENIDFFNQTLEHTYLSSLMHCTSHI